MLVASYVFYMYWETVYIILIASSTLVGYLYWPLGYLKVRREGTRNIPYYISTWLIARIVVLS
jgi:hypothetical protein